MKSNCKVSQQIAACSNMIIMIIAITTIPMGMLGNKSSRNYVNYRLFMSVSAFMSLSFVNKLILDDLLVSSSAIYTKKDD